jgi:hypothetical protein
MMTQKFEMSMMGELTYFLGFQVKQLKDGTFLSQTVNHLGPFGNVLVINDNCLWTNDSWRNKNAGLDHIEQEILKNHPHWLWIR